MKTKKYLHVELNPTGLYVYVDDQKHGHKEVTIDDLNTECCMVEGITSHITKDVSIFKDEVAICIDLSKLQ